MRPHRFPLELHSAASSNRRRQCPWCCILVAVDIGGGIGVWCDEARVEVLCVPSSNVGHRLVVDLIVVVVEDETLVGYAICFEAGYHAVGQDTACEGSES